MKAPNLSVTQGYVYILSNPAFQKGLYKIGMTTRSADQRAWEIYTGATGVPAPFQVEFTAPVSNCLEAEQAVHLALRGERFRNEREFFLVPLDHAKNCIKKVAVEINTRFGTPTYPPMEAENWIVLSSTSRNDELKEKSTNGRSQFVIIKRAIMDEDIDNQSNPRGYLSEEPITSSITAEAKFSKASIDWKSPIFWFVVVLTLGFGVLGNIWLFFLTGAPLFLLLTIPATISFFVNIRD